MLGTESVKSRNSQRKGKILWFKSLDSEFLGQIATRIQFTLIYHHFRNKCPFHWIGKRLNTDDLTLKLLIFFYLIKGLSNYLKKDKITILIVLKNNKKKSQKKKDVVFSH